MLPAWSVVFGVAFGAAIGSFLNVLIYRLPRRLSIVFPPSHCPTCQHRLGVRDLVPLLSYLVQRGRCRYCRAPIALRYFLVELWSAGVWGWLWWQQLVVGELPLRFVLYALACSALIAIFFIDMEHTIIPDELNLVLLVIGLLHAWLLTGQPTDWAWAQPGTVSFRNAFWSAEIGAGILCLIAIGGRLLFRRDAMGHGDIKLVRAMGALLLLPALLVSLALAVAGGALIGGVWLLWQARRQAVAKEQTEGEPSTPEPILSLLLMCLLYLLWLDVILSLLPMRWQERLYARLGQSDETEEEWVEMPGMLPFGPFLAIGAQLALLLGAPLSDALRAYLAWAGF